MMFIIGLCLPPFCFWLGRQVAKREIAELRADVQMWRELSTELHDENRAMRLAAREPRS
jgi:hypothetical protein